MRQVYPRLAFTPHLPPEAEGPITVQEGLNSLKTGMRWLGPEVQGAEEVGPKEEQWMGSGAGCPCWSGFPREALGRPPGMCLRLMLFIT